MKPKTLILILLLFSPILPHCAYYDSPGEGRNDSGLPDSGGDRENGDPAANTDLPPPPCQSHQDCREDQRCLDGECLDAPLPCGNPGPPDCAWGLKDPQECDAAGGWIECSHLDPTWCWCECPSGDSGCPCWQGFHCQGHCLGDQYNCIKAQVGECSDTQAFLPLGCWCVAYSGADSFEHVCAD